MRLSLAQEQVMEKRQKRRETERERAEGPTVPQRLFGPEAHSYIPGILPFFCFQQS